MLLPIVFRPFPPVTKAVLHERNASRGESRAEISAAPTNGIDRSTQPPRTATLAIPPTPNPLNTSQPPTIHPHHTSCILNAYQNHCTTALSTPSTPRISVWHIGTRVQYWVSGALMRCRNKFLLKGVRDQG